jgi:hypothetical protein
MRSRGFVAFSLFDPAIMSSKLRGFPDKFRVCALVTVGISGDLKVICLCIAFEVPECISLSFVV